MIGRSLGSLVPRIRHPFALAVVMLLFALALTCSRTGRTEPGATRSDNVRKLNTAVNPARTARTLNSEGLDLRNLIYTERSPQRGDHRASMVVQTFDANLYLISVETTYSIDTNKNANGPAYGRLARSGSGGF